MKTSIIKPGLLVSLRSTLTGGVSYARNTIEGEHITDTGAKRAAWETVRTIEDPREHDRATQARSKARAVVSAVCCHSAFGLLCPSDREHELEAAVAEARAIAEAHNDTATLSRIDVYVMVGRVAQDDVEAAKAIRSEMAGLIGEMQAAIKAADPEAIRDAATRARSVGGMLSDDVGKQVTEAISQARKVARELVKQVEKGGKAAADVVATLNIEALERARVAFLDMDEGQRVTVETVAPEVEIEAPGVFRTVAPEAPELFTEERQS